jgi:hypothetical protein
MKNPNHTGGFDTPQSEYTGRNKAQANVNRIQAVMSQGTSMDGQCNTQRLQTLYMYFLSKIR